MGLRLKVFYKAGLLKVYQFADQEKIPPGRISDFADLTV
jgi:hypothetical protein